MAAAVDLIWLLILREALHAQTDRTVVISNFREHVLPQIYPEAYEGGARDGAS